MGTGGPDKIPYIIFRYHHESQYSSQYFSFWLQTVRRDPYPNHISNTDRRWLDGGWFMNHKWKKNLTTSISTSHMYLNFLWPLVTNEINRAQTWSCLDKTSAFFYKNFACCFLTASKVRSGNNGSRKKKSGKNMWSGISWCGSVSTNNVLKYFSATFESVKSNKSKFESDKDSGQT